MTRPQPQPPQIAGLVPKEFVASGGYADVFCYEQQSPRRMVAVKVLAAGELSSAARQQFSNEGNAMARLAGHSNILTVFWADTTADGRPYLVMEYCRPPNLGLLAASARLSVADVLRHGVQLSGAVETVHRAGLLHRDIKPANLLVARNGLAKLTDFGISAPLPIPAGDEPEGMSVPWSPAEVLFGTAPADARSDVYSLAATLYSLLAGRSPFEVPAGDNQAPALMQRIGAGDPRPTGRPDAPASLERLLRQALAVRPAHRLASAAEFGRALQGVERELNLTPTILELPGREEEWRPSTVDPLDGPDRTRLKRPVAIDAQGSNSLSPPPGYQPPVRELLLPSAMVLDRTAKRPEPEPEQVVPDPVPDERGRPGALLVGVGLLIAVVLAASGVAYALHRGNASAPRPTATATQDALADDAGPVPTPVVSAARSAGAVLFTWTYDGQLTGDAFLVRRLDTSAGPAQRLTEAKWRVPAAAALRPCIEVTVVRANGRISATPGQACAP